MFFRKQNSFLFLVVLCQLCIYYNCEYSHTLKTVVSFNKKAFHYIIDIPSMDLDSVHITIKIANKGSRVTAKFVVPPMYADNPFLKQTGINFCNLKVTDSNGKNLAFITDSIDVGPFKAFSFSFSMSGKAIVEYDAKFLYTDEDKKYMPLPRIGKDAGYLQGSYLFAIPYNTPQTAYIWRDNYEISAEYRTGSEVLFFGDPQPIAYYDSPYELLFSNNALLSSSCSDQILVENETVANQNFNIISVKTDSIFSSVAIDNMKSDFSVILEDIIPIMGTLNNPFTIITGFHKAIGLEGMHAFCLFDPQEDENQWLGMTAAHELIHCWIGVRVGEYDIAWWKEGTTFYLGCLVAKRNELCDQKFFEKEIALRDLSEIPETEEYSLSNENVRNMIYQDKFGGSLVYRKGGQVAMLIDRRICEKTDNKLDLLTLLAEFVKVYNKQAFYKEQYFDFIEAKIHSDIDDIITLYVDGYGAIPDSVLQENYEALGKMGVLGKYDSAKTNKMYKPEEYGRSSFEKGNY